MFQIIFQNCIIFLIHYFQNCFDFPPESNGIEVSEDAKDLMKKLICDAEFRLGQNGLDDFKVCDTFKLGGKFKFLNLYVNFRAILG